MSTITPTRRTSKGRTRGFTQPRTGGGVRQGTSAPRPRPAPATRPPRNVRAPRAPFVMLVVGLLGGGLVSLLLLNTVLAQDAFTLHALRQRTTALEEREQALRQEVARAEAPGTLARKARDLGMVPARGTAFVDPGRGRIVTDQGSQDTGETAGSRSGERGDGGEPPPDTSAASAQDDQ